MTNQCRWKPQRNTSSESTKLMYTLEVVLSKSPLPKTGVQALTSTITMKALMPCQLSIRGASLTFSDHLKRQRPFHKAGNIGQTWGQKVFLKSADSMNFLLVHIIRHEFITQPTSKENQVTFRMCCNQHVPSKEVCDVHRMFQGPLLIAISPQCPN